VILVYSIPLCVTGAQRSAASVASFSVMRHPPFVRLYEIFSAGVFVADGDGEVLVSEFVVDLCGKFENVSRYACAAGGECHAFHGDPSL
jgi:hypothetical protein